jgi:Kef-type K+ transport system membrane component KefB
MQALESHLVSVLLQLCVIIAAARSVGVLFRKVGQPPVVGEIVAGLMLGPSVLGKIELALWGAHPISAVVFSTEVTEVFSVLKELGLVFLLFLIGMEFDFSHLKADGKAAASISLAGVVLPFALGISLGWLILPHVQPAAAAAELSPSAWAGGFVLFMGTAMSITALPVLGRMMMEWGVTRTRIGTITIGAAVMGDAVGWILLGTVAAAVASGFSLVGTLWTVGLVIGYALFMIVAARPLLVRWVHWEMKRSRGVLGLTGMAALIIVLFMSAMATSKIGIFSIFGAFILGAVLSGEREFREAVTREWRNFIFVFFLPIFFTYTGLRTDVGTLQGATMWLIAAGVIGTAILGKVGGCALPARWSGFGWRESAMIGIMMNTRGLMELIVIDVGHRLGVIPSSVFAMLVIMAVLTTVMTTPIVTRLMRNTEFEPLMGGVLGGRNKRVTAAAR